MSVVCRYDLTSCDNFRLENKNSKMQFVSVDENAWGYFITFLLVYVSTIDCHKYLKEIEQK